MDAQTKAEFRHMKNGCLRCMGELGDLARELLELKIRIMNIESKLKRRRHAKSDS